MVRTVIRHAVAVLATVGVLAASPFLARALGSGLTRLLTDSDGSHFYALTWSFGDERDLEDAHVAVHPASPGLAILVGAIMAVCLLGDILHRKWSALSWALPFVVSIPLGVWLALLTRRAELPADASVTISITVGLIAFALVGAYWWTIRAMVLWQARGTE